MRQNGISEYRAELMAISMFAILLTHFKAPFGVYALERVALLCQGGVDVFLFLSGFGLYYSGMKSDNPLRFYSKRFKRIFPSFWVVMLLTFWHINKLHWPNVLWGGSTLAFWFQSTNKYSFGWFVSLIVVLYAVFPWFFRLFRKHPKIATLFFNFHPVAGGRLLDLVVFNGTCHLNLPTKQQKFFGERCLTRVRVRDDSKGSSTFYFLIHQRMRLLFLLNFFDMPGSPY